MDCLVRMGKDKIVGEMGQISTRKPAKVIHIEDENLIPEDFASYTRVIDRSKVKDALKNGEEISGASLIDGKKSIQFKMKGVKA